MKIITKRKIGVPPTIDAPKLIITRFLKNTGKDAPVYPAYFVSRVTRFDYDLGREKTVFEVIAKLEYLRFLEMSSSGTDFQTQDRQIIGLSRLIEQVPRQTTN